MLAARSLIVLALAFALAGCDGPHGAMMGAAALPASFESNGERIYFLGASGSGSPVRYAGGNMHLQMMGGGCATCHGADRAGTRMMPRFWLVAPPLTREALFERHGEGDGHGDHTAYDEHTLRRAIEQGVDPSGHPLSDVMPRWSMSDADWHDLMSYLRR